MAGLQSISIFFFYHGITWELILGKHILSTSKQLQSSARYWSTHLTQWNSVAIPLTLCKTKSVEEGICIHDPLNYTWCPPSSQAKLRFVYHCLRVSRILWWRWGKGLFCRLGNCEIDWTHLQLPFNEHCRLHFKWSCALEVSMWAPIWRQVSLCVASHIQKLSQSTLKEQVSNSEAWPTVKLQQLILIWELKVTQSCAGLNADT